MGQAIAGLVAKGGNTIDVLGEADTDKAVTGDIVVLAVPCAAIAGIVSARGSSLAGKIVVDITNPVNSETFDSLVVPADGSTAAELAKALPDSHVLKAFNTTFAGTLASGVVGDLTTTVVIAGDDADAKALLAGVVTAAGLAAVDAGSLSRAHELEAIGFLQITLAALETISWVGGFGLVADDVADQQCAAVVQQADMAGGVLMPLPRLGFFQNRENQPLSEQIRHAVRSAMTTPASRASSARNR